MQLKNLFICLSLACFLKSCNKEGAEDPLANCTVNGPTEYDYDGDGMEQRVILGFTFVR